MTALIGFLAGVSVGFALMGAILLKKVQRHLDEAFDEGKESAREEYRGIDQAACAAAEETGFKAGQQWEQGRMIKLVDKLAKKVRLE